MNDNYEVVVIGSGAGGGTLAYALSRLKIPTLLIEKGQRVPREEDNWKDVGAFGSKYIKPVDMYHGSELKQEFEYPFVGGQTKFYGAALYRLRKEDFSVLRHVDGESPAWPISYSEMEKYYTEVERIYKVHGTPEGDITEPPRSTGYPYPAVRHEKQLLPLINRLRQLGVNVSSIPRALDLSQNCIFCNTCDGYTCKVDGKMDTEVACIQPAVRSGFVDLMTETECKELCVDPGATGIHSVRVRTAAGERYISARCFVLSCGIWETPALLLRSASPACPNGLANSSGNVGRNLAGHNIGFLTATTLGKWTNIHQKTFAIHDYYLSGPNGRYPLGLLQATGRVPLWMASKPLIQPFMKKIIERSFTALLMNEVVPDGNNAVRLARDGKIVIDYQANNLAAYGELRKVMLRLFRKAGYWAVRCSKDPISETPWHPVGTARMGNDPATSVINARCRSHDIGNLYVVDSSSLPTAGAVNTSMTVMALALRAAEDILRIWSIGK
jgi:choline dehydrogenase-like flavoprotein